MREEINRIQEKNAYVTEFELRNYLESIIRTELTTCSLSEVSKNIFELQLPMSDPRILQNFLTRYQPDGDDNEAIFRQFKNEIDPGLEGEQGEVEHNGAGVERQDVCPFHKWQTSSTKFLTQLFRDFLNVFFIQCLLKALKTGSHIFLCRRVTSIEKQKGQLNVIRAPMQGIIVGL